MSNLVRVGVRVGVRVRVRVRARVRVRVRARVRVACLRSMAASPSADWKAAASEARTAFPSSRWPATWVARSVKHS